MRMFGRTSLVLVMTLLVTGVALVHGSGTAGALPPAPMLSPRGAMGSVLMNGKIYVAGGGNSYAASVRYDDVDVYDLASNTWSASPTDLPDDSTWGNVGDAIGGKWYLTGGYPAGFQTRAYDPANGAGGTWTAKAASSLFYGHVTAPVGGKLYTISNFIQRFDPAAGANGTWATLHGSSPASGEMCGAAIGTTVYAVGWGGDARGLLAYDTTTDTFRSSTDASNPLAAAPEVARGCAAVAANGKIVVMGGSLVTSAHAKVQVYDPATGSWSLLPDLVDARYYAAAEYDPAANLVHVIGGFNASHNAIASHETFVPGPGSPVCSFNAGTMTVSIPTNSTATLSRNVSGALLLNGGGCGGATVANTTQADITGVGGNETLVLDVANGPLGPSATAEVKFGVDLGAGNDTFTMRGSGVIDTFRIGTTGANLNSDNDGDVTLAGVEAARMEGLAGHDVLSGAAHASVGSATLLPLVLDGGLGKDKLTGGDAGDQLLGLTGNDTLDGGLGNDDEQGGDHNDTFVQGAAPNGSDDLWGSTGFDKVDYSKRPVGQGVTVNLTTGPGSNDDGGAGEGDDVLLIESVTTGKGHDVVTGDTLPNTIVTGQGDDTINAGDGNDNVTDGVGNDIVNGDGGSDTFNQGTASNGQDDLVGGPGSDVVNYGDRNPTQHLSVTLNGGAPNDDGTVAPAEGDSVEVENVTAGQGNDTVTGNTQANRLKGGTGNDVVNGGDGNDTLTLTDAVAGNDTGDGGAGATDTCTADVGDTIVGCP